MECNYSITDIIKNFLCDNKIIAFRSICTSGNKLINFEKIIAFKFAYGLDKYIIVNMQKYSQTTSKIQNQIINLSKVKIVPGLPQENVIIVDDELIFYEIIKILEMHCDAEFYYKFENLKHELIEQLKIYNRALNLKIDDNLHRTKKSKSIAAKEYCLSGERDKLMTILESFCMVTNKR